MKKTKDKIFTFKADSEMSELLEDMPNRSAFIREAIVSALEVRCPLCQGNGILTQEQRRHWERFLEHHQLEQCQTCHALHITCGAQKKGLH